MLTRDKKEHSHDTLIMMYTHSLVGSFLSDLKMNINIFMKRSIVEKEADKCCCFFFLTNLDFVSFA